VVTRSLQGACYDRKTAGCPIRTEQSPYHHGPLARPQG
jgi:hypothetical protein